MYDLVLDADARDDAQSAQTPMRVEAEVQRYGKNEKEKRKRKEKIRMMMRERVQGMKERSVGLLCVPCRPGSPRGGQPKHK